MLYIILVIMLLEEVKQIVLAIEKVIISIKTK